LKERERLGGEKERGRITKKIRVHKRDIKTQIEEREEGGRKGKKGEERGRKGKKGEERGRKGKKGAERGRKGKKGEERGY
jgi:hypothetical protein